MATATVSSKPRGTFGKMRDTVRLSVRLDELAENAEELAERFAIRSLISVSRTSSLSSLLDQHLAAVNELIFDSREPEATQVKMSELFLYLSVQQAENAETLDPHLCVELLRKHVTELREWSRRRTARQPGDPASAKAQAFMTAGLVHLTRWWRIIRVAPY